MGMSVLQGYEDSSPEKTVRGVALGGFMGSGKSTIGRILSARSGVPLVDMDHVLTERFGPISDQFATEGEAVFRARERALVAELCDGTCRIVSTGGGVFADAVNRVALRQHYGLAVLHAPFDVLAARISADSGRPLAQQAHARWLERRQAYADADAAFRTDGVSSDVVADRVEAWWRQL